MFDDEIAQLPDRSLTALPGQHQTCCLPNSRMRVGDRHRPSHHTHGTKIVDVVAEVGGMIQGNAVICQPIAYDRALVVDAVDHFDT